MSHLDRKEIPSDCLFFTADIVNLYPGIDSKIALTGLDKLLREAKCPLAPLSVSFTRLVLENNFVKSPCTNLSSNLRASHGIAIFCHISKYIYVLSGTCSHRPFCQFLLHYGRFIDDLFSIWNGSRETLIEFLVSLIILIVTLRLNMLFIVT